MPAHLTADSEFSSQQQDGMLRTPSAIEGEGGAIREDVARAKGRMLQVRDQMAQLAQENGLKVPASIQNLPTPTVNDMGRGKTVEAWDEWTEKMKSKHGNGNGHGPSLDIEMLRLSDTPKETNWGKFEPAIRRWEKILGRAAPAPTNPDGRDGTHRLSSKLTEWMMGLPDGWITDCGLTRNEELKAAGNGVVPQQATLALKVLLSDIKDKI